METTCEDRRSAVVWQTLDKYTTLWDCRTLVNILLPVCLSACILREDSSIDVCGNLSFDGSSLIKDSDKSKQRIIECSLLSFMRFDLMMG